MFTFKIRKKDGEYAVRFYINGKFAGEAKTYYTTDKVDAENTGRTECARMNALVTC